MYTCTAQLTVFVDDSGLIVMNVNVPMTTEMLRF
jgi:hypothetical protein